jgi:PTS hybrid protein
MNFFTTGLLPAFELPCLFVEPVVGIVLVSHSEKLAQGLQELILQLAPAGLPVAAAGGLPDGGLGTSHDRIRAAIATVDQGVGVIILADLGSAVLTTIALLDDDPRDDVVLVDAPLVEGAVSAGVIASTGADLPTVIAAAEEARTVTKL